MSDFGEFLYTLRKEKNMTQAELAERLGVTNKAVSKWETGEAMPDTNLLLPIARIFDVSVDELLNGKRFENTSKVEEEQNKSEENEIKFDAGKHLFTRGKDDEEDKTLLDIICGAVCAFLSLSGIVAYLCIGAFTGLWTPYWVITAIGALSCGIVGIVFDFFNKEKREKKRTRGENPFVGGICGIVMLVCIITYISLGAFLNLWHPYWIIVVVGVLVCGVLGPLGKIVTKK